MANDLGELWKKGTTVPEAEDLKEGGLAIDVAGKKAYSKGSDGAIFSIGGEQDEIGLGTRGQFLATNDAEDGTEWKSANVGMVAQSFLYYGHIVPKGSVYLDGTIVPISKFQELYDVIQDRWNNYRNLETPPEGHFRIPIGQNMMLFENECGHAVTGTHEFYELSAMECMWTGSDTRLGITNFDNNDFFANGIVVNGFNVELFFENDDFSENKLYSNGFGDLKTHINNDLVLNASLIKYFGNIEHMINNDLIGNMLYNIGMTDDIVVYRNVNFVTGMLGSLGMGEYETYSDNDFAANELFNDGFTY